MAATTLAATSTTAISERRPDTIGRRAVAEHDRAMPKILPRHFFLEG